ncbi:phosphoenolpyruvate--protein phosphotransferase [Pontiellaceae bacterium B1224]|nr:phosphoenolpyruvate--protein phosphotransferase [Pontiellaceae bacterium B1224]
MKKWKGTAMAPGFADGRAFIYTPNKLGEVQRLDVGKDGVDREIRRFEEAVALAEEELKVLKIRVLHELGESEAAIFDAHIMMLKDPDFTQRIHTGIAQACSNAEYAIHEELASVIEKLKAASLPYLRERTKDMADIEMRLLGHLKAPGQRGSPQLGRIPPDTVVVAKDLLPSDTFALNRDNVVAIITETGGRTSHASILCRALGIPKVSGIEEATETLQSGERVLVDAENATVVASPTGAYLSRFSNVQRQYQQRMKALRSRKMADCSTKDGIRIFLHANLGSTAELDIDQGHPIDGIGLFRSEYLFLQSRRRPTLEQHYRAYCAAAHRMKGKPLIIRTMDFGGDKYPSFFLQSSKRRELDNQRGLLYSLEEGHMLQTQLRAIIRAHQKYPGIEVMFPMVLDGEELQRATALVRTLAASEKAKGILSVGAMIETPSSVFEIDSILDHADFVSIGTNDLSQYMLAGDRELPGSNASADGLHPAILKAIHWVAQAAKQRNIRVSVCGEVAGEPALACLLVGMGIRHLSLNIGQAAVVSHYLRTQNLVDLENAAHAALMSKTLLNVRDAIQTIRQSVKEAEA